MSDAPEPTAAPNASPDAAPNTPPDAPPRPAALRAFVNERGVDVPPGGTALDAVRAFDALAGTAHADAVLAGARVVTDSRGLPVDPAAPAHGGAIYRLLPARPALDAPAPSGGDEPEPTA